MSLSGRSAGDVPRSLRRQNGVSEQFAAWPVVCRTLVGALAALLLFSCASTGPTPPETRLTVRDDPYLLSPGESYPLSAAAELNERVGRAFGVLHMGGDLGEVEAVGREVLAEDPGFHPAAVLVAQVEYLKRQHEAAIERLLPVVSELPDYEAAQLLLGRVAELSGDLPVALEAFSEIPGNTLAAERAEALHPRAIEIIFNRLLEAIDRGRVEDAEDHLGWLIDRAADSREVLEGSRLVALERADPETELEAVRQLAARTGERAYRQREAELEVEIGDLRSGLELLEQLNREFPEDLQLGELLEQAEFLWRLQLLPPEVQEIGRKVEIDRADVALLLYWLIPRVRYSQITNPPIAADILDHPQREAILRVLNLGLMEIDETLHRFDPMAPASRVVVLKAQLVLLGSSQPRLSCLNDARELELDVAWSSLCRHAARCQLIPEAADCRPAAPISGAEALELFRQTLNLLGSGA